MGDRGERGARSRRASWSNALVGDESAGVRETAAWALGQLEVGAPRLRDWPAACPTATPRVRATAAWALGQMEVGRAPAALVKALKDEDEDVRLAAAWALSQIGDSESVAAITEALRSESSDRSGRRRSGRSSRPARSRVRP